MPWKVNCYMLVESDQPIVHDDKAEAEAEAEQIMFMQPKEMIASVVECDENGEEV